jgi:tRNA_anti-like
MRRASAALLGLAALSGCNAGRHDAPAGKTITSEEVRLWAIGAATPPLKPGHRYRIAGTLRSVDATEAGLPDIIFTGVDALLDRDFDRPAVAKLNSGDVIAIECELPARAVLLKLQRCHHLETLTAVSADDYFDAYQWNPFRGDSRFKDRELVIHGKVLEVGKLTDGKDYVSLGAMNGMADVKAIMAPEAVAMMARYAQPGEQTEMLCRGGYRWNPARWIGLANCRFL